MTRTVPHARRGEQASRAALLPEATALAALTALHRAISAFQFYPPRHASLEGAMREGWRAWQELAGDFRLGVSGLQLRDGQLWLGEEPIGTGSPAVASLVRGLSVHGIAALRQEGDLTAPGFEALVALLAASPEVHHAAGGAAAAWARSPHAAALALRGLAATPKAGDTPPASSGREEWGAGLPTGREATLLSDPLVVGRLQALQQKGPRARRLLDLLLRVVRAEEIEEFLRLLQEVVQVTNGYLDDERYRESFDVVLCLYREAQEMDAAGKPVQRDYFLDTVRVLVRGPFLGWLIGQVASARGDGEAAAAEYVLRTLGHRAVVPVVNTLVAERSRAGRRRLVDVLVALGDVVVPSAVRMLEDRRWFVVRNMVIVLGGVGTPEAVHALLKASRDPDPRVRREVARALSRVTSAEGEQALRDLVADPDPGVQSVAIAAAGSHRSVAMLEALWQVFRAKSRAPDWGTREAVVRALGRLGLSEAVPLLGSVLSGRRVFHRDKWDQVRVAAVQALGEIGGEEGGALLERLRHDRSPEVRAAVVRALASVRADRGEGAP